MCFLTLTGSPYYFMLVILCIFTFFLSDRVTITFEFDKINLNETRSLCRAVGKYKNIRAFVLP